MAVKTSISLSEHQAQFARQLVDEGLFPSLSAVAQHGIELIRQRQEAERTDTQALQALLKARSEGEFLSAEDFRARIRQNLEGKRKAHGLDH